MILEVPTDAPTSVAPRLSKAHGELVNAVERTYQARFSRMWRRRHRSWLSTLLAVRGRPDCEVGLNGAVVAASRGKTDASRFYMRRNSLFTALKSQVANMLQNDPVPVVLLGRSGADAARMQQACERFVRWIFMSKDFDTARQDAATWCFITGTGFLGVIWDMTSGPMIEVPVVDRAGKPAMTEKHEPMIGQDGRAVMSEAAWPPHPIYTKKMVPKTSWTRQGDLRFVAPTPFDVFPDTSSRSWRGVRDVVLRQHVERDKLVEAFGGKARHVQPDVSESSILEWVDDDHYVSESDRTTNPNLVRVLSSFELPSKAHPEGRHVMVAGGFVLHSGALPGGELPIHPVYDMQLPDDVWGVSSLEQAFDMQRALNAVETDRLRNHRLHGNPGLMVEEGSLVEGLTRTTSTAGAVIELRRNRGSNPDFLEPPQMPGWLQSEPERLVQAIEDQTGVHRATRGDSRGMTSGRQFSAVAAQDLHKWSTTIRSLARSIVHSANVALTLWKDHGPPAKMIDVYGPNGSPMDVALFRKDWIADGSLVRIDASEMMPYNAEVQRQHAMEAWQLGIIPDIQTVWKVLRNGEMGRLLGSDDASRNTARMEQDRWLEQGQPADVLPTDDHMVHIDEHLERMRSPEFRDAPAEVRQAYLAHVAEHQVAVNNPPNPVLTGASPMPQGVGEGSQNETPPGGMGLAPSLNNASGALTNPGVAFGGDAPGVQ